MLSEGTAKKVTIYVNEDTQWHGGPLYESILTFLMHKGVAGATAIRAMAGFGSHHVMHTPKIELLAEHLPVLVEFVESPEKVEELLPTLYEMVTDGLIEVSDTCVIKITRKSQKPDASIPHQKHQQPAKMMRVFLGESDRWQDETLYEAIVKKLRVLEVAGATVYRGIQGYGAKKHLHKGSFLHLSKGDAPIMISVVDAPDRIARAIHAVEEMLIDGLIVISDVEMIRLVRGHSMTEETDATPKPS